MHDHHLQQTAETATSRIRLQLAELYCECCAEKLEDILKANPHVKSLRVDFLNNAIEITYHPSMISPPEIESLVRESDCCCLDEAEKKETAHLHHRAQMAPVTMGSKYDRMQYEMPAT